MYIYKNNVYLLHLLWPFPSFSFADAVNIDRVTYFAESSLHLFHAPDAYATFLLCFTFTIHSQLVPGSREYICLLTLDIISFGQLVPFELKPSTG